MSHEEEDGPRGIRVVDKRRFDSEGNDKDNEQATTGTVKPSSIESIKKDDSAASKAAPPSQASQPKVEREDEETDMSLSSFIMSMGTQAMMLMGELSPPDGMPVRISLEHAKQTIDIIAMLRNKTRGNLDELEEQLFEELMHSLRIGFVKATQRATAK